MSENKSITWSGARNPLWIVRKGSKDVEELKTDRQSIGMVEKPKRYKHHEVKLAKGDLVFVVDGYQDQFGGEKGRKYMKGRFIIYPFHPGPIITADAASFF